MLMVLYSLMILIDITVMGSKFEVVRDLTLIVLHLVMFASVRNFQLFSGQTSIANFHLPCNNHEDADRDDVKFAP